jgi:nitroreductase
MFHRRLLSAFLVLLYNKNVKEFEVDMKRGFPKPVLSALLLVLAASGWARAQETKTVKLSEPNKTRGLPVMEAFAARASVRDWSDKALRPRDLSDLLWAADGVNRPEIGKRTAASAMNAQDVDVYVVTKDGAFLYGAKQHALLLVAAGDHREELATRPGGGPGGPPPGAKPPAQAQPAAPPAKPEAPPGTPPPGGPGGPGGPPPSTPAPVQLFLVSDLSRFTRGTDELKKEWAAIDAGIVSATLSLFCAGTGLATRPRAGMNKDALKGVLKLTETQYPVLNHPVGYPKEIK